MINVLYLLFILKNVHSFVNISYLESNSTVNPKLQAEMIKFMCEKRDSICKDDASVNICTARIIKNSTFEYKDFKNACYLFISNFCEFSEQEFAIVHSGRCRSTDSRRLYIFDFDKTTTLRKFYITISPIFNGTPTTRYNIPAASDGHPCPHSCTNTFEPWCIYSNKRTKFIKFYKFMNHCAMDVYYCKHWRDFEPTPEILELNPAANTEVDQYYIKTTGCSSQKFYYYYHFSELASTLQRHGYLEGNHRYSKILKPDERNPAYG